MNKRKRRKPFKTINLLKVLWTLDLFLGIYLYAMGCRIFTFSLVTLLLLVYTVFRVWKKRGRKGKDRKKKKPSSKVAVNVDQPEQWQRSLLKGMVKLAAYIVLLVVLYEFVMYSVMLTQMQLQSSQYRLLQDVKVNEDGSGLTFMTSSVTGNDAESFTYDGWLLDRK